jgi:hypothetical protein
MSPSVGEEEEEPELEILEVRDSGLRGFVGERVGGALWVETRPEGSVSALDMAFLRLRDDDFSVL